MNARPRLNHTLIAAPASSRTPGPSTLRPAREGGSAGPASIASTAAIRIAAGVSPGRREWRRLEAVNETRSSQRLIAEAADRGMLRRIALGWPPAKLLRRLLAVSSPAGSGMTGGCRRVPPNVLLRSFLSISGSQHDLKFIEFIPLGIGPLSVRDRQEGLQALSRGNRSGFVHGDTISLFDKAGLDEFRGTRRAGRWTLHRNKIAASRMIDAAPRITAPASPRRP